jgi:hypothetical protein
MSTLSLIYNTQHHSGSHWISKLSKHGYQGNGSCAKATLMGSSISRQASIIDEEDDMEVTSTKIREADMLKARIALLESENSKLKEKLHVLERQYPGKHPFYHRIDECRSERSSL